MPYPLRPMDPNDPNYDPALDPHNPRYNPNDQRLIFNDPTGRANPAKDDDVADPDAFLLRHINQSRGAAAKSDDDVANPDEFLSQHISGKKDQSKSAALVDSPAPVTQRVQNAFEAMDKQPDMVSRMFPIKSLSDVQGMSKRYGYYLATHPYATLGATAALPLAGLIAPEAATGVGATIGLLSRTAPYLGFGEALRGFQDIPSLYKLISGAGE